MISSRIWLHKTWRFGRHCYLRSWWIWTSWTSTIFTGSFANIRPEMFEKATYSGYPTTRTHFQREDYHDELQKSFHMQVIFRINFLDALLLHYITGCTVPSATPNTYTCSWKLVLEAKFGPSLETGGVSMTTPRGSSRLVWSKPSITCTLEESYTEIWNLKTCCSIARVMSNWLISGFRRDLVTAIRLGRFVEHRNMWLQKRF